MWLSEPGDVTTDGLRSDHLSGSVVDTPPELFACKQELGQSTSASGDSISDVRLQSRSVQDSSRSNSGAHSEPASAATAFLPKTSSGGSGGAAAGSSSSIISWGPPKQLEAAAPPPPPPAPTTWTPALSRSSYTQGVPAAQPPRPTYQPADQPFLPQPGPERPSPFLLTAPGGLGSTSTSMTQLLFSSSMEQDLQKSRSLASLGSRSQAGAGAGAGAKAGRRSKSISSLVTARVTPGVVKDTTRRKNAEIMRLQQELEQKMSLATDLENENRELQQRERLLKLQVSTGERRLFCESVDGITPHVQSLIQNFRSSFNQMIGGNLLAQMPKDPKKFTIKEFMITWQSLAHEMAETLMEEAGEPRQQRLADTSERIANWCMSVCVNAIDVMVVAGNTNMQTGEEHVPTMEFWSGVVEKLNLTQQQVNDLRTIYTLYGSLLNRVTQEYNQLLISLSTLMDQDLTHGNIFAKSSACFVEVDSLEQRDNTFKKLRAADCQCNMLHSMLSFVVLSLMDPEQQGLMVFNSFPCFPNLKLLLVAACQSTSTPAQA